MMKEIDILGYYFRLFLSQQKIEDRIRQLANAIGSDYQDLFPLFLVVLKGAFPFAKDLIQEVGIPSSVSFIRLASFEGFQSSDEVLEKIPLTDDIRDRHVIILEDIIESGKTLFVSLPALKAHQPASIKICSLLLKPDLLKFPINVDYLGFRIPDDFVVGYGLDYKERGRELKDIYQLIH